MKFNRRIWDGRLLIHQNTRPILLHLTTQMTRQALDQIHQNQPLPVVAISYIIYRIICDGTKFTPPNMPLVEDARHLLSTKRTFELESPKSLCIS